MLPFMALNCLILQISSLDPVNIALAHGEREALAALNVQTERPKLLQAAA
jgi:hypothetical protein